MKLTLFVQTITAQAPKPGVTTKSVQLASVPAEGATPSPNAPLFKDGNGAAALNVQNITGEAAAYFAEGRKYTVTIEPVEETAP